MRQTMVSSVSVDNLVYTATTAVSSIRWHAFRLSSCTADSSSKIVFRVFLNTYVLTREIIGGRVKEYTLKDKVITSPLSNSALSAFTTPLSALTRGYYLTAPYLGNFVETH